MDIRVSLRAPRLDKKNIILFFKYFYKKNIYKKIQKENIYKKNLILIFYYILLWQKHMALIRHGSIN